MELLSIEQREISHGELELAVTVAASEVDAAIEEFHSAYAAAHGGVAGSDGAQASSAVGDGGDSSEIEKLRTEYVLNRLTTAILAQQSMRPVLTPRVHAEDAPQPGTSFSFEINVVLYPELTLSSVEPVTVSLRHIEVEESDIRGQLAYVARQFAAYEADVPRPVGPGDVVRADVEATRNGRPARDLSGDGRLIEVRRGLLPEALVDGVLGMNVGESRSFQFDLPREGGGPAEPSRGSGEASDRRVADSGSTAGADRFAVQVTIRDQMHEVLPEIDDAWVERTLPDFGSLERLREHIRRDLESQRAALEQKERVFELRAALAKRLQGTIPDALYEFSSDRMFKHFEKGLAEKGQSLNEYLAEEQMSLEHFQMTIFVQASEYLRQNLALDALTAARGIEIDEQDIEAMKRRILPADYLSRSASELEASGFLHVIQEEARRQKAFEWLAETAIVQDAPAR